MMMRHSLLKCLLVSSLGLLMVGCHSSNNGTASVNTSNGSLPIRREASLVVDMAQPNVSVSGNQVTVTGNVRLKTNTMNPDARVQISVIDRYGQVADQINAKLAPTDEDRIMTYRVMFGPVPAKGSSLLVAYDDYHPFANYSGEAIGSGGGGYGNTGRNASGKKGNSTYYNGSTSSKGTPKGTGTTNTKIK
jgi:hypothetical protein